MSASTPPLSPGRIVAIHQPNYLPWLGYFFKLYASDTFVFHDQVEYTKKSLIKRTRIRQAVGRMETSYLIIPLQRHSDFALIGELYIDHKQQWQRRQLNQVRNVYAAAPYFETFFPFFRQWMEDSTGYERLAPFNAALIGEVCALLGIDTPAHFSSAVPVTGRRSDYNMALVEYLEGRTYLSGAGAGKYQTEEAFTGRGIRLIAHDLGGYFRQFPYVQAQGPWLPGLSVLDALFNIGTEGIQAIFRDYYRYLFGEDKAGV